MTRLFGTNGVRGIANSDMSIELATDLGRAIGTFFGKGEIEKILPGQVFFLGVEGAFVGIVALTLEGALPVPDLADVAFTL